MTEDTERAQVGWRFWLWWVLATTVGLGVGFSSVNPMRSATFEAGGIMDKLVFGAVAGASVGIAQWLVLRGQVSQTGWWVLASTVGLAVGFGVTDVMTAGVIERAPFAVGEVVTFAVAGGVMGASVGIAQQLVLRRQVSQTGRWVWASSVGLAMGVGVNQALPLTVVAEVGWAVYGAITGSILVLFLRGSPDPSEAWLRKPWYRLLFGGGPPE